MNVANAPKSPDRITEQYNRRFDIKSYDTNNLYPQSLLNIVNNSPTLMGCLTRYIDFVEGRGLANSEMATLEVNERGETLNDLIHLCAQDKCTFGGFALLIGYNIEGKVADIYHVPFEDYRLEESDDDGYIAHIAVHPDWKGQKTKRGEKITVEESNIEYINTFNPNPAVVRRQIEDAGGIRYYKGQLLYYSQAGHLVYPTPIYDSVISEALTDLGINNVLLRNVRNNFLPAGILTRLKSKQADLNTTPYDDDEFESQLAQLQGDTNALKILSFTAESKDEVPTFTPFNIQNLDKAYTATDDMVKDKIYSIFNQEGWLCIRNGKVGFGGELLNEIKTEYSERTEKDRLVISSVLSKVLKHYGYSLPAEPNLDNLKIKTIVENV